MNWIQKSFKNQIIFILFLSMLALGLGSIFKNYADEKAQLNMILESQTQQLGNRFALSIASKVFYNELYELSEEIFNLYEYNHKNSQTTGTLFTINTIAIVNTNNKIVGHSHPKDYPLQSLYVLAPTKKSDKEAYALQWSSEHTTLQTTTPVYFKHEIVAYIYMSIDPLFLKAAKEKILKQLFLFGALFILLFLGVSVLLARLINKPMEELLKNLEKIGTGNLDLAHTQKRKDEFFTLSTALLEADKRIVEQKEELLEAQETLEDMVEERTTELEEALADMQKYQEQLVETEKMSALGSLVAGVAHEINTPIGVSLTGITFIESETKQVHKKMQEQTLGKSALSEYFETVQTMAASMHLSLIQAAKLVRSFKQVAIDQHTEEKRDFNLKEYIDEVTISLHSKLKDKNIVIYNEIQSSVEIFSYAGIFSQVFTNFIMNSLLHAFEDDVKDGEIFIKGWAERGNLYLTYEDNGKGIDEENIKKIFDPFFTTKLGQGGSGLGLNIIYNLIMHKLKGDIYCTNKKQGIIMTITIPMQESEDE